MAKVTIAGQAVVVTSTLKLDDIKTVATYRPDALTLYEGEGKERQPVFAIGIGADAGRIGTYGVEFGRSNAEGFAQLTMSVSIDDDEDIKVFVAEQIGRSILKLNKLEEQIPEVIRGIEAEKADILRNISVVE